MAAHHRCGVALKLSGRLSSRLSKGKGRQTLIDLLNANSASADETVGEHFQDPALAAFYSDEVRRLTDNMITFVQQLYEESRTAF